jgi:hypothetical protein
VASLGQIWVESLHLKLDEQESLVMDASDWRDVGEFGEAFVLCEFDAEAGSFGADLTVDLETSPAVALGDGAPWAGISSAVMSSRFAVITGRLDADNPPMGPLRLRWTTTDPVTGTFRAFLLLKN